MSDGGLQNYTSKSLSGGLDGGKKSTESKTYQSTCLVSNKQSAGVSTTGPRRMAIFIHT